MQRASKLYVIGIGYRPLSSRAKDIIAKAEVILASDRLFDVFRRYDEFALVQDRIKVINNVNQTLDFIGSHLRTPNSELRTMVLLASGDPFFFGIGRRITEEFGPNDVEILPDLSSVQEAFARIKEPWDDAFFLSLHGGPDIAKRRKLPYEAGDIPMLLQRYGKLGILTDKENNPGVISRVLQDAKAPAVLYVCEHLGYPDEKVIPGTPAEFANKTFADPNVVIVLGDRGRPRQQETCFGLREEEIEHERGLITKDEVRAVTLHKLRLPAEGVLWDIGAGSGSVSLEAARMNPRLRIFALEKDHARAETIMRNISAFAARNVTVMECSAPDGLAYLPSPDRVFIGGSSGSLDNVVKIASGQMTAGMIVINCATLDTLNLAIASLERFGLTVDVTEISVSRSRELAGRRQMAALNPVFIVTGEKG